MMPQNHAEKKLFLRLRGGKNISFCPGEVDSSFFLQFRFFCYFILLPIFTG